jgi:hypothetical protein
MVEPEAPQRGGEARSRVSVRPVELPQARRQELGVRERDERSLETCAPEEAHRGTFELLRLQARNEDKERGSLVQLDVG